MGDCSPVQDLRLCWQGNLLAAMLMSLGAFVGCTCAVTLHFCGSELRSCASVSLLPGYAHD